MTTLIESEVPAAAGSTRRRWPWIVASLLVVVAIGTGTGLFVAADHYRPLTTCCSEDATTGSLSALSDPHGVTLVSNELGTEWKVPTAVGSTVDLLFTVANTGSRPVKILSFGSAAGMGRGVTLGRFESTGPGGQGPPLVAFKSFTLSRDLPRDLWVTLTFNKTCPDGAAAVPEAGGVTFESFPVTYEFAGIRHTVNLSLNDAAYSLERMPICW